MNGRISKEEKEIVRRYMLKQRNKIAVDERAYLSEKAVENLLSMLEVKTAQRLFTFLSFGSEICLDSFITSCWETGKEIYVPKTYQTEKRMIPYRFTGWDSLVEGMYGIREPHEEKSEPWNGDSFDIILVPGVAFTERGARLGYGGGFYDRFFAGLTNMPTLIAVCFEQQVIPFLPVEKHDYRVDKIITESRSIICS
jgi:5-formyltetrahydrofolate cyclo-ligase